MDSRVKEQHVWRNSLLQIERIAQDPRNTDNPSCIPYPNIWLTYSTFPIHLWAYHDLSSLCTQSLKKPIPLKSKCDSKFPGYFKTSLYCHASCPQEFGWFQYFPLTLHKQVSFVKSLLRQKERIIVYKARIYQNLMSKQWSIWLNINLNCLK